MKLIWRCVKISFITIFRLRRFHNQRQILSHCSLVTIIDKKYLYAKGVERIEIKIRVVILFDITCNAMYHIFYCKLKNIKFINWYNSAHTLVMLCYESYLYFWSSIFSSCSFETLSWAYIWKYWIFVLINFDLKRRV